VTGEGHEAATIAPLFAGNEPFLRSRASLEVGARQDREGRGGWAVLRLTAGLTEMAARAGNHRPTTGCGLSLPRPGISLAAIVLLLAFSGAARAQRIENGVAVFAALDKVTARISKLEIKLGDTVNFGALKVTPRACYTRAPTEPPKTTSFVEIQEVLLDGKEQRIFSGWMFAESPGLNAVEHPVFDIWLTDCAAPTRPVAATQPKGGASQPRGQAGSPAAGASDPDGGALEPRRRPRR
jgi:hypothetical protein